MARALQCDCGFEATAQDEDELLAEVQRHARDAHGMALSRDEALLLAFHAELSAEAPAWVARRPGAPIDDEKEEE